MKPSTTRGQGIVLDERPTFAKRISLQCVSIHLAPLGSAEELMGNHSTRIPGVKTDWVVQEFSSQALWHRHK